MRRVYVYDYSNYNCIIIIIVFLKSILTFFFISGKEMHRKVNEAATLDHTKSDCIIVSVLTHGINGKLYSTDGDLIPVDDFTKYFDGLHCPALIGKPKVG